MTDKTKTIEVSEKIYAQLVELANEMTTQDPRGTRMPHMFQIRDWKKVYDADLNGNVAIFIDRDYNVEIETLEELIEYLNDSEVEFDPDEIKEMWEDDFDPFALPDWLEENDVQLQKHSYSLEPVYTNCFLTAKAAKEHLEANYYHYHKNADVYLNHAWRNPEADLISEFLCGLIGKKMHE
jgi:hypothetical protein